MVSKIPVPRNGVEQMGFFLIRTEWLFSCNCFDETNLIRKYILIRSNTLAIRIDALIS
jgi:hypothetical protein